MTFAFLWTPGWPTAAASRAEPAAPERQPEPPDTLVPALLALVPRVVVERRGVVWADVGGLPLRRTAIGILTALRETVPTGNTEARIGIASTPITAEVAACFGGHIGRLSTQPITAVRAGRDRAFLARHPIDVLSPSRHLSVLLVGIGIETCGALAALAPDAVELRFGVEGARLRRLALADDPRPIFAGRVPELPSASVEWTDYAVRDVERLLFTVNALVMRVSGELESRGLAARRLVVRLALADGTVVERAVTAARATVDRARWMRVARYALAGLTVPDAVVGVAVRADAATEAPSPQGDLYDRGFGTAREAERAVGRVEDLGGIVAQVRMTGHPLPERRIVVQSRDELPPMPAPPIVDARPELLLRTMAPPIRIRVATTVRRDHHVPVRYWDGPRAIALPVAAGPDRVAGGRTDAPYAREYFRCIGDDGEAILLYRDVLSAEGKGKGKGEEEVWYLAGRWE